MLLLFQLLYQKLSRNSQEAAMLQTLFARILLDFSVCYTFCFEMCARVYVLGLCLSPTGCFRPCQQGFCAWFVSLLLVSANHTCVRVCARLYMRVCKYVIEVTNIHKYKQN